MSKFLYPIYKLNIESYKKWWLYHKKAGGSGILSEILQGFSFNLENTLNRKFKLFEIEGNSVQDGSPSPDNEVPILSAGDNGSINEKISNKNWFNKNGNFKTYNATVTPIDTGIKVENNDGGTYRSVWCEIGKDELLGKTLTIQTSISTYNGAIPRIIVVFNNETAQYIAQIKTITDTTEGTLVNIPNSFPENADRVSLIFYCSFTSATPKGSYVEYKDFQVELGSTATSFVEHKEQDYSIFVQQPMRSTKDKTIKDKFVIKSDSKIYERHYINRKIFDGTEYWTFSADQGGHSRFDFRIADAVLGSITNNPIQSNRFRTNFAVEDNSIFLSGVEPMISIICDEFKTLDGFKTMLAEKYANGNPVYADYLRKTPLDLPCTPEQIQQLENRPSTYKDFTYVVSEDETEAYLKIQYWKEVQS